MCLSLTYGRKPDHWGETTGTQGEHTTPHIERTWVATFMKMNERVTVSYVLEPRIVHCGYLRFLVYFWVHLRAEQGEKSHYVPPSEAVLLSTGHVHHLLPDHLPADHDSGSESQGLGQNAVCGEEGTG